MISKYDDAPEDVRKFAFAMMQMHIRQDLATSADPAALLAIGAQAGVDAPTQASALRWLAEQESKYEQTCASVVRVSVRKAAERFLVMASRIQSTLKPQL